MKKTAASILNQAASPFPVKKTNSKSTVPNVTGFEKLADQLNNAVAVAKEAEADRKLAEEELLPKLEEYRLKQYRAGKFSKSFNVVGKATNGVQITYQDKFSGISAEHEQELRALDPKFDDHFEQVRSIKLKRTDLEMLQMVIKKLGKNVTDIFEISLKKTDDATIEMLGEKFGNEFANIFEVVLSLIAKEHLDEKLHEIPETAMGFVKQAKGSVKLR